MRLSPQKEEVMTADNYGLQNSGRWKADNLAVNDTGFSFLCSANDLKKKNPNNTQVESCHRDSEHIHQ